MPLQGTSKFPQFCPLTADDFQIVPCVPRFRYPEILFQPIMFLIDQACLDEIATVYLQRLSTVDDAVEDRISNSIFVTGCSSLFPGLVPRLEAGIRQIHPYLSNPLQFVRASDLQYSMHGEVQQLMQLRFSLQHKRSASKIIMRKGKAGLNSTSSTLYNGLGNIT